MIRDWPFAPFLLAAYPILALFAENAREVRTSELALSAPLAGAAALAAWLFLLLILRDAPKAGLLTSLIVALFFTINPVTSAAEHALKRWSVLWVKSDVTLSPAAVLVCELALVACFARLLRNWPRSVRAAMYFLNVFAAILIAIPAASVIAVKTPIVGRPPRQPVAFALPPQPEKRRLPDIYYIILDGYARSDIMKSRFQYDNAPFLAHLQQKGFYVAQKSTSNYCQTPLSLSSSLNGVFLDDLVRGLGVDQTELSDLIGTNNVMATLKPLGYKFVSFATGFDPTEHPEADLYCSPQRYFTGFQWMIIGATPLRALWTDPKSVLSNTRARERILYLLDHLPDVAQDPAPTFTFAHLLCPHAPFVFGENGQDVRIRYILYSLGGGERAFGRFRDPADYCGAYRGQAVFITRQIEKTIDKILAASPEPPIIILQSDHGSELNLDREDVHHTDLEERMSILNAYFFPDRKYDGLYDDISPVNTFRVVLNTFFGAHLELLPDRSYFSTWPNPYQFIDVSSSVRSGRRR